MVEDCLFLWVVFFVLNGYHCLQGEVNLINVNLTDNVLIDCSVGINVPLTSKRWHFGKNLLYTGVQRISDMGSGRIDLLQNNYSLSITRVSLSDEGMYNCTVNGTRQCHRLRVNVHPRSFYIHVGGINFTTGSYLPINKNETLTLSCHVIGVRPEDKLEWLVNNVTVDESSVEFNSAKDGEDEGIFNAHSILQFHPVHRRGTLTCVRRTADSHIHESLHLPFFVYEPPMSFFMTVNGSNVSEGDNLLIEASTTFEVQCQVRESAPANNISWVIGNETKYSPLTYLRYENSSEETFFDTSSSLEISIGSLNQTLACVRRALGEAVAIEVYFTTFARAQMNLIINEDRSLRDISINEGDYMLILCEATGSRPNVELSITVIADNFSEPIELINKSSHFNEDLQTFDSMMKVLYLPAYKNGTVICSCEGTGCPTKSEIKRFYTAAEGLLNMETSFNYFLLTIGAAITTFSFAFVIVFNCVKAVLPNATQLLPTPRDRDATSSDSVKLNTLLRRDSSISLRDGCNSHPGCYTSRILPEEEDDDDTQTEDRISRCLPKVPTVDIDEGEYAYYSDSRDIHCGKRTFQLHDVCVLTRINFGDLFKRWTGTLSTKEESNKCVVITTTSDAVSKQKEKFHWIGFVQRLLDLPEDSDHLVQTHGIYIDGGNIYILQEHLDCQSLQSLMDKDTEGNKLPVSTAKRFILDILKGMELIHSYGLLHPGISRSKVLVSDAGHCKLYDFCLAEDAVFVFHLKQLKSQDCHGPPESLQKDVYTSGSDVWSVAGAIWEIMTNGAPLPVPRVGYFDANDDVSFDSYNLPDPVEQFGWRRDSLRQCWLKDGTRRPSICELRTSFEEVTHNLDNPYMVME